jgi:hypothetical protein
VADAGHRAQETAQPLGVGVEELEGVGVAAAKFVLRLAGAQRDGEVAPKGIEALIGHLEHSADIRGLALVEEEIGGGRVVVGAVAAFEEVERDEGVEEVARRPGMQTEASTQLGQSLRVFGELSEQFKFDCAQQRLGCKEAATYLHYVVHPWFVHCDTFLLKS